MMVLVEAPLIKFLHQHPVPPQHRSALATPIPIAIPDAR